MDLNSQGETGTLSYTHILLKTTLYRINLTLVSTQCPMTMKPSISQFGQMILSLLLAMKNSKQNKESFGRQIQDERYGKTDLFPGL